MKSKSVISALVAAALVALFLAPAALAGASSVPATVDGIDQGPSAATLPVDLSAASLPVMSPYTNQIDQNQPSGPTYMAAFSQTGLAQSFQQTHSNISGAGILLQANIGSSDNVTIQVWTGLPNAGGTMLAQASATGTQGQWVDVFWTAVSVTPGTTYYLVFTGNTSLGIAGSTSNPYPYGCVYANSGYQQFPSYDYAFRTYYDDAVSLDRDTWAGVKALFE